MVTKVYGTVNGTQDIILTHIDGDLWQTEIPSNLQGFWVCALYAENDSGNRAFICKVLFAITGHQMKMYVIDDGYTMDVKDSGYVGDPELEEFTSQFADLLYKSGVAQKLQFKTQQIERGYKCGYILCDGNKR